MSKQWKLGYDGYIMQYLLAGARVENFKLEVQEDTQLEMETKIRSLLVPPVKDTIDEASFKIGEMASIGLPWTPYVPFYSSYLDVSAFSFSIGKVSVEAATCVIAPEAMKAHMRVWSYMSSNIYLNGILIGGFDHAVYKPMMQLDLEVELKKGRNILYIDCMNLAARDSRNMMGIQFMDHRDELEVALPDDRYQDLIYDYSQFINSIRIEGDSICFDCAPEGTVYQKQMADNVPFDPEWISLDGCTQVEIEAEVPQVEIRVGNGAFALSRAVEFYERRNPVPGSPVDNYRENLKMILEDTAKHLPDVKIKSPHADIMTGIIARAFLDREDPEDMQRIHNTLDVIEARYDCADFELCALLRYMHMKELPAEVAERTRKVVTNYRYWQTERGWDAICFWSENHAIGFYTCQVMAGDIYPDEYFPTAKMTGRELAAYGRRHCTDWLNAVIHHGFEEFLSAGYLNVTLGGLLNLYDYAGGEVAELAEKAIERMMTGVSRHVYKGCMIAPMGRIYRGIIYPFAQECQGLIRLFDVDAPRAGKAGWLSFLAGSQFEFKPGILETMKSAFSGTHENGNALITLEKQADYCLTSVASPRMDGYQRWKNTRYEEGVDKDTNDFCRSQNETFHGTSFFQPGTYGYQQHMWMAALDPAAVVFVNAPGTPAEKSSMRPGYWYGNYVMPAVRQDKNVIASVYHIPADNPIHFTHAYIPVKRFDECQQEDQWFFLKKGEGYLALWSSAPYTPHNDMIFGCEYRAYSTSTGYVCVAGSTADYSSMEEFKTYARSLAPSYDDQIHQLKLKGDPYLQWIQGNDRTQYLN